MEELISRIVVGMSYGSIYALLAVGLVLTYKTSGVFNLAYGAQAFVSAAIYYDLRVRHDLPIPVAFVVPKLVPVNHAAMTETPAIGCPVTASVTFATIAAESRSIVMFAHVVT